MLRDVKEFDLSCCDRITYVIMLVKVNCKSIRDVSNLGNFEELDLSLCNGIKEVC